MLVSKPELLATEDGGMSPSNGSEVREGYKHTELWKTAGRLHTTHTHTHTVCFLIKGVQKLYF